MININNNSESLLFKQNSCSLKSIPPKFELLLTHLKFPKTHFFLHINLSKKFLPLPTIFYLPSIYFPGSFFISHFKIGLISPDSNVNCHIFHLIPITLKKRHILEQSHRPLNTLLRNVFSSVVLLKYSCAEYVKLIKRVSKGKNVLDALRLNQVFASNFVPITSKNHFFGWKNSKVSRLCFKDFKLHFKWKIQNIHIMRKTRNFISEIQILFSLNICSKLLILRAE